ncbi:GNAT family N-acetyltransferase [Conexibacter sp. SYSU D00693]|uniref:GNAT family N-acetyltransferase n=1 Tax=Conexibacter sp. SYSU D00693 TaxID=2812560 RepID=UPI00196B806D|nr:GNAT family N-acetyltransferase [Conexibacter sp. SYSU D00693]
MRLRDVTPRDVPAVAALVRRADATHLEAHPQMALPTVLQEETDWHVRLARHGAWAQLAEDEDGTLVGAVAFSSAREQHHDGAVVPGLAHLSACFVEPARFGQGIGGRLLVAAHVAMRERGFERARLWTIEGSPAERLYARHGWVRTDARDRHPVMGVDLVQYVLELPVR